MILRNRRNSLGGKVKYGSTGVDEALPLGMIKRTGAGGEWLARQALRIAMGFRLSTSPRGHPEREGQTLPRLPSQQFEMSSTGSPLLCSRAVSGGAVRGTAIQGRCRRMSEKDEKDQREMLNHWRRFTQEMRLESGHNHPQRHKFWGF